MQKVSAACDGSRFYKGQAHRRQHRDKEKILAHFEICSVIQSFKRRIQPRHPRLPHLHMLNIPHYHIRRFPSASVHDGAEVDACGRYVLGCADAHGMTGQFRNFVFG
jgi:hypothetical protein